MTMAMIEATRVALFAGQVRTLPGDSRSTGMFKTPVAGPVAIGPAGLAGDQQADLRVHGGPDKALHFYPVEHYALLAARFPDAAALLLPGSIGENLSGSGIGEGEVCLGDVFALGRARVQVSQPRQPCWKIDARYGVDGMTAYIAESGITGGYLRVLEAGSAETGDALTLLERRTGAPTLAAFWRLVRAHRPGGEALRRLAESPGLAAGWVAKLRERAAWFDANPLPPP